MPGRTCPQGPPQVSRGASLKMVVRSMLRALSHLRVPQESLHAYRSNFHYSQLLLLFTVVYPENTRCGLESVQSL